MRGEAGANGERGAVPTGGLAVGTAGRLGEMWERRERGRWSCSRWRWELFPVVGTEYDQGRGAVFPVFPVVGRY